MDNGRRTPSLHLISASHLARPLSTTPSSSHRPSQSPFRYVRFDENNTNEKETALSEFPLAGPSTSEGHETQSPLGSPGYSQMRPWIPVIMYAFTSLGFLVAIAFFKTELFSFLDELSGWLRTEEEYGYCLLFLLIFITTFPPMPLYSTFIILSGYTFGPWIGAAISYVAALTGAVTVFIISRTLFRRHISEWLENACSMKRVVCAIEKRPKLLFLIRLAPYPYNVMNCLLAGARSLTLQTYTVCTAMSLFKVIIHTSLGASMHSFKDYGGEGGMWTIGGVVLCVAILIYLSYVARKAVNEELEAEETRDLEMRESPLDMHV